jgi:hypothetical protein
MDGGLLTTHADFQSNPPQIHGVNTSSTDHGTPVYGIVFGDGASDPSARGFLPDADGIFSSSASLGDRYAHTQELVDPFGPYRACFQTNSWGGARTIYYTTVSSEMDDILFDLDFLITQSQSNAGNADSRPQAWAKNIVSVGGICHFNSLARGDDRWNGCGGGSTGPATDGRIKPDLWHFYDATLAPSDASPTSYTQFGGTSGATPIVAGHFGLFFELWADGIFGNPVGGGDAFDERPHATTAKAMMINTAHRYRYVRPSISRHNQGWGMPDLAYMYDLRDKMLIVDESDLLAELGTNAYVVQVEPNEPAFSATLVYADPPGATSSSQHRINDLSLRVTSPTGEQYWGNFGLDDSDSSLAGGWSNTVDTVENVLLDNPVAGRWLIEVLADEINEDGHVESPELDADYALVVSGVTPVTPDLRLRVAQAPGPLVAPGEGPLVVVEAGAGGQLLAGAPTLHYRHDAGGFLAIAMSPAAGDSFTASIPAADCGDTPEFYVEAQGVGGATVRLPDGAPTSAFQYAVGEEAEVFADDFESNLGWTVGDAGDSATTGVWNRGDPEGTPAQPENDHSSAGTLCWVTNGSAGGSIGTNDIDGGQTTLLSPLFDLSAHPEAVVSYWRWYCNTGGGSRSRTSGGSTSPPMASIG